MLVSATYDGDKRKAVLKFYDAKKERVWLWEDNTGHQPYCVPADTILLGDNKTIKDTVEGDETIGLTGGVEVRGKSVRFHDGEMIHVHATGILPFSITPEHPVLVAKSRSVGHRAISKFEEPRWELAANLSPKSSMKNGDYLVFPIPKGRYDISSILLRPI